MQDKNGLNYNESFELKIKTHVDDLVATEISQEPILQTIMFCNCCLLEMQDKNITRDAGQEYTILSINCQIILTVDLVVSKDSKVLVSIEPNF